MEKKIVYPNTLVAKSLRPLCIFSYFSIQIVVFWTFRKNSLHFIQKNRKNKKKCIAAPNFLPPEYVRMAIEKHPNLYTLLNLIENKSLHSVTNKKKIPIHFLF